MYPYKNVMTAPLNQTTYEQAINGNVVPSEELVDFDATPHAQTAKERIAELDVKIAELQKIVDQENAAKQKDIDMMQKDPRFAMSAIEYITRGDTSGFNNIAQSIQAKNQMDMNERIQKAIRNKSDMEEVDRLVADRKKAISAYNTAVTVAEEYAKTGTNIQRARAKKDIEEARAELNRINKRLGREADDGIVLQDQSESSEEKTPKGTSSEENVNELLAESSTINKFATESEKTSAMEKLKSRTEFREDSPTGNKLRDEYERLSKIKSSESYNAEKAKAQAEYDALKTRSDRNDWVRANPSKAKLIGVKK